MLLIVLYANLPSLGVLMIVIINTLMVGINEELMFRGILFYGASSSFGIWRAVWITAIIFGSVHILNSLITGDFRASVLQAFFCRYVWYLDCSFANPSKHNYSSNHNSLVVGLSVIPGKFHLGSGIASSLTSAFQLWSLVIT
jgi:membrane protease YdiL (CAAX protease family)